MRKLAMAGVVVAIVPGLLLAQADTSRMHGRDTARARTYRSSAGAIGHRNYGLTHDQISQLQTALKQDDCNPGAIDGVMGPRTRSAMACARRSNNVNSNNPNDLFRSLNLSFTTSDSTGMGGVMSSGRRGMRGTNRTNADTSMNNRRMGSDTTHHARRGRMRRDTTMYRNRPDSSNRPGMTPRSGTSSRPDSTRRPHKPND